MRWCCAAGPGTPLLEVPPAPVDLFGPMHIRVHKTEHKLCSRKITKFVAKKAWVKRDQIDEAANDYVKQVKEIAKKNRIPSKFIFNADQTGLVKELHGARSLAYVGQKNVLRIVESVSATMHSCTVLPMIGADGSIHPKTMVVLQEPGGSFPPTKQHFQPDNLVVAAHTTHIMTKALMIQWLKECVVTANMPKTMLLVLDSWAPFRDHDEIRRHVPAGTNVIVANIPGGATGKVQPLDVFFFGIFKRFIRKITSHAMIHGFDFKIHQRDNLLKAVLVTEASDEGAFCDRLKASAWNLNVAAPSTAAQALQQVRPVLVLLDNKLNDLPALAKTLHHNCDEDVLFCSISDRPLTEKRRKALSQADVHHNVQWNSRDTVLVDFVAKLTNRLRVMPALLAVLDEADQAIEVCDDARVVQYVNRAYESVTGCLRQEVIGQPESDMRRKSLPRPRDDQLDRRRSSDWKCIRVPSSSLNSQFVYMKRRSVDGSMYRDVSLKSLKSQSNAGTEAAPISEVLTMLRDAAGRIEGEPAHLVRDAMKALTSHEMYGSSLPRVRDGDRIAKQYYDGLVRLHHQPARQRKRSVVDAYKDKRGSHGERRRVSADVKNALENDNTWQFDILQLERVAENHVLTQLGMKIFDRWKVTDVLNCSEDTLLRWMTMIELNYRAGNAYHNATHAADVLQATSYFLDAPAIAGYVAENHAVAAIIAAAVHDLDHPGRGNAYLINTRQQLAIMYNDHSVLENHHVAYAFQLTLTQNNHANIFGNLGREEFNAMRIAVVEMVLATDISRHFDYLKKFVAMANTDVVDLADDVREANSMIVCNMLVKCADISNPTREWALCQKWAFRIVEEYFDQTREEREKGLPFTMSLFDRNTCNVPATQTGFIDMFVREAFSTFSEFAELPHLAVQLEQNYKKWGELKSSWTPANNQTLSI